MCLKSHTALAIDNLPQRNSRFRGSCPPIIVVLTPTKKVCTVFVEIEGHFLSHFLGHFLVIFWTIFWVIFWIFFESFFGTFLSHFLAHFLGHFLRQKVSQKVIQKMVPKFKSNRVFLRKRKNEVIKSGQKMSQKSVKKCQKKS